MLKHMVDSLDEVPEALRAVYAESNGKFFLQVDGMVPKSRLDEFRNNNVQLLKERDELTQKVKAFGDITPEEIAELRKNNAGKSKEEIDEIVKTEIEKRVGKMREDYEGKLAEASKTISERNNQLSRLLIDNELTAAAARLGIRAEAMPDVVLRGRSTFVVENGRPVAKTEAGEIVYGKDGTTPLSVSDWLAERVSDAPHWFNPSNGSGARGNNGSGGGAPNSQSPTARGRDKMRAARQTQNR